MGSLRSVLGPFRTFLDSLNPKELKHRAKPSPVLLEHDGDVAQELFHLRPLHPVDRVGEPQAAGALVRPAGLPRLRREHPRLPHEAGAVGDARGVDRAVEDAEADAVVALGHGELDGLQIVNRESVTKKKIGTCIKIFFLQSTVTFICVHTRKGIYFSPWW